jgi:ABC-type phosphate transport system substrate-binding protein
MRGIRKKAILTAAIAAALVGVGTGTALADPPSGTTPALTDIVGVGSDTLTPMFAGSPTENSAGAFQTDYNATVTANKLWSWDAVNPTTGNPGDTIVTKGSSASDTTCSTTRPNGSGAGITELKKNTMDGGAYCVDYARSSRKPAAGDGTAIAFAALAKDAIAWSSPAGTSGTPSPVPATLTFAQIKAIYTCADTNWSQVGGSNAPIVPVIPQAGSGTRATFLLALGGGTTPLDPTQYPCIVNGTNSSGVIEENTGVTAGNVAQFGTPTAPKVDNIFPYSIGDYIAQTATAVNGVGGHQSSIWARGNLVVRAATDDSGVVQQPTVQNTSSQTTINPSYPSELQRTLYAVVRNGGTASAPAFPTAPAYDATALPKIFGPSGWICTSTAGKADTVSYGFLTITRGCGALTAGLP